MDERRRDLERKAATTGSETDRLALATERVRDGTKFRDLSVDEQVALLRARRSAGDLSEQGLGLAAWAGLPAARQLVEPDLPDLAACETLEELCERVSQLDPFGPAAVRQVVAVLARFAAGAAPPELRGEDEDDAIDLPRDIADAVESWAAAWSTVEPGSLPSYVETLQVRLDARAGLQDDEHSLGRWGPLHSRAYEWLRGLREPLGASAAAGLVRELCVRETGCHVCQHVGHDEHDDGPMIPPGAIARSLAEALIKVALAPVAPPRASGPRAYSPKIRLFVDDVLDHPKFGRGRVTRVAAKQADVLFDDGATRKLVHGA